MGPVLAIGETRVENGLLLKHCAGEWILVLHCLRVIVHALVALNHALSSCRILGSALGHQGWQVREVRRHGEAIEAPNRKLGILVTQRWQKKVD